MLNIILTINATESAGPFNRLMHPGSGGPGNPIALIQHILRKGFTPLKSSSILRNQSSCNLIGPQDMTKRPPWFGTAGLPWLLCLLALKAFRQLYWRFSQLTNLVSLTWVILWLTNVQSLSVRKLVAQITCKMIGSLKLRSFSKVWILFLRCVGLKPLEVLGPPLPECMSLLNGLAFSVDLVLDNIHHYRCCPILWQLSREALSLSEEHFSIWHWLCLIDCSLDKLRLLAYSHLLYDTVTNDTGCVEASGIIENSCSIQRKCSNLVKALRPFVS